MKRILTGALVLLAALFTGYFSHAAGPAVKLGHTLTGYNQQETKLTADYSLHVENQNDTSIADLTVSLVPLPPLFAEKTTINLGYFAPHEKRDVFLRVVLAVQLDPARLSKVHLYWAGTYVDGEGKVAEFAVRSDPGGAQ